MNRDEMVTAAAEAIWRVDPFKMGDPDTWTGAGDQAAYFGMSAAAVDAVLDAMAPPF